MIKQRALTSICLGLMLSGISAPAWAVNEYFPTWYFGLRGSINTLYGSDLGTYPLPDTDYDPGFGLGANFGLRMPEAMIAPLNRMRFEVEFNRYWNHIDNNRTEFFFPLMIQSEGERELTMNSYMVNMYYDFPFNTMFVPYIGGGIGRADVELEPDPVAPITGDNKDTVNAWQAMVGFSFHNHPEALTEWSLGYRYFTTDDPTFDDGFGGQTVIENTIHSLEAGVKFRF